MEKEVYTLFKRAKDKQSTPVDKNSKFYLGESIERPNIFTRGRSKSITAVPKNPFTATREKQDRLNENASANRSRGVGAAPANPFAAKKETAATSAPFNPFKQK